MGGWFAASTWLAVCALLLAACGGAAPPPPPSAVPGEAARTGAAAPSAPVASAAASATAAPAVQRAPLTPAVKIQVGYSVASSSLPLFVAVEKGYFQDEGLELELTPFTLSTDQFPALASGQLDFGGAAADTALFNAIARGIDTRIIAYFGAASPTSRGLTMMVRQDLLDGGRYKDARDFRGMDFGIISPTSSVALYFEMALVKGGLTLDDVNLVSMPFPDMNVALANKRLDGAVQVQPFVTQAESQGVAQSVFTTGELAAGYPSILLLMGAQFAQRQPEAAKRFLVAFLRAQRDIYQAFDKDAAPRDEMYAFLAKYTPLKDPAQHAVLTATGAFGGIVPNGQIPVEPLEVTQEFFLRRGTQQEHVDMARAVDPSYGEYAAQQLGRLPTN